MLSIQPPSTNASTTGASTAKKCTPNLLPARISHAGPVPNADKYWKTQTDETGVQHAYFRGRHLYGTSVALPENYTGAVLSVTEKDLPAPRAERDAEDEDEEEDERVEVKIAERVGDFDEVVIWGHGGVVDASGDAFTKGVNEWIGFAEAMHCEEDEEEEKKVDREEKSA
ncbi:hypothetical protein BU24DRAFT_459687 [Aaosphaeria arxii CBS 175.79]|uniref:Uncharacterized protein n=1 Tax=Aaosphaeria arxii CBS 175.79 TaxID=1450172 RepID=A0A6A5Y3F3_9PLEO|nr:uncharacterized protein BU24DRAFT_459687 [Aaosphaeria arxii CBS 175.79]KAF2020072.1 hypothetical protein BU24DRAFT_459687 [Aaosphaeria arxii CBS 175.79]